MERKACEFAIGDLLPIGLALIVASIGIAYGLDVITDVRVDACDGTRENFDSTLNGCYFCRNTSHPYYLQQGLCSNETTNTASDANVSALRAGDNNYNASTDIQTGILKIPAKMPIIATIVVAAIIMGVLTRYFIASY